MIYPMFAMILLTLIYALYTGYSRVLAAKSGEINPRYFKTMSGYDMPEKLQISTRHFANLLETPPLFYIAGALIIALEIESSAAISLGWLYLGARLAQMYIHNTYNYPLHRMVAFLFGFLCIFGLWIIVLIHAG
jgi:hypothetical protein